MMLFLLVCPGVRAEEGLAAARAVVGFPPNVGLLVLPQVPNHRKASSTSVALEVFSPVWIRS